MGMTIAEKIFSGAAGGRAVRPGDYVDARIDRLIAHEEFYRIHTAAVEGGLEDGLPYIWDLDRFHVVLEHFQPALNPTQAIRARRMREIAERYGLHHFKDTLAGVLHRIALEDYVVPGELALGSDSHSCAWGALNCAGTGMGEHELAYAAVTGELWFRVPESIKVVLQGELQPGVTAKDVALWLGGRFGTSFALYQSLEFTGPGAAAMSLEGRFTLAAHAVELGAKFGLFDYDDKTEAFLAQRPDFERLRAEMRPVSADADASYEQEVVVDLAALPPQVARPHTFENVVPVGEVRGVRVSQAQIGSCANGHIEDIALLARALAGRKVHPDTRLFVQPSSWGVYGVNNFPILAVPLFLLTGAVMNAGGISDRIFGFAAALVGHIRGGLAHVNVIASFIFSGMSGAAAADVAGLGQIEIRAMTKAGYPRDFACAVTGASATIGPIVPPSVPLILYGVIANTSVTKLFIGGIVPGVLMVVALMAFCAVLAKRRNFPKGDAFRLGTLTATFQRAFLPLMTPVIIIGGIWSGVFTPTEAAAVAAAYAIVLATLVYREVKLAALVLIFRNVALTSSAILFILAAAMIYNNALTRTQVPGMVTEFLFALTEDPLLILLLLNLLLFVAGMFMSTAETILLLAPLIAPLLPQFGIDPIHFGVLMVLNLMLGQLTPPFGIVLYVLMEVGEIPFDKLVKALVPFYLPILVVLALTVAFPPLVTWLPGLVIGR